MKKGNKYAMWIAVLSLIVLSSCNRGIGCQSDFSLHIDIVDLASQIIKNIF